MDKRPDTGAGGCLRPRSALEVVGFTQDRVVALAKVHSSSSLCGPPYAHWTVRALAVQHQRSTNVLSTTTMKASWRMRWHPVFAVICQNAGIL